MKEKLTIWLCLVLLVSPFFAGCSKQNKEPSGNKQELPISLLNAALNTERTIKGLERVYIKKEEEAKKKQREEQNQENNNTKSEGKKGDKEEEGKNKEQKKEIKDKWKEVKEQIKKLHKNWNQYESRSSISSKELNSMEKELNGLTESTEEEKLLASLWQANQFSLNLANLYKIYDSKLGNLKKMEAYTRQVIYLDRLEAEKEEQLAVIGDMKKLMEKVKVEKELKEKKTQLKEAVKDLEIAVKEDNSNVLEIKRELILNKLSELEK